MGAQDRRLAKEGDKCREAESQGPPPTPPPTPGEQLSTIIRTAVRVGPQKQGGRDGQVCPLPKFL